jgi:hypothetical protein
MTSYTPVAPGADGSALPERVPEPRDGDGGTHSGLPRRTRQASLAPQLRDAPPANRGPQVAAQASALGDDQIAAQSAERARSLISSVQHGWRSGRAAADRPGADPGNTGGTAGRDRSGSEGDKG